MRRGTIALDIDGTITDARHQLPDEVALLFATLYREGWHFIFMTGREFVYAMEALSKLNFAYDLAVQNGADLLRMPGYVHIKSNYFDQGIVHDVAQEFAHTQSDFLLYAGYEKGDFCYYRPHRYSEEMTKYLQRMQRRSATAWKAVEDFRVPDQSHFPMIKAIGRKEDFLEIEMKLLQHHRLECVIIQDPKNPLYHYLLITAAIASKQKALEYFLQEGDLLRPLIVAGDDYNDRGALEFADVRIVMDSAPATVKMMADIIAPPSRDKGIITALTEAIELVEKRKKERA